MKWILVLAMLLLCAVPAVGQEDDAATAAPTTSLLTAAAWCPVYTDAPTDDAPGCDMGVGVALYRRSQLAAVAAVGTKTVGVGVAWVVGRMPTNDRPIAISLGAIAPYDERGIDAGRWGVAMGVTFGFGSGGDN